MILVFLSDARLINLLIYAQALGVELTHVSALDFSSVGRVNCQVALFEGFLFMYAFLESMDVQFCFAYASTLVFVLFVEAVRNKKFDVSFSFHFQFCLESFL